MVKKITQKRLENIALFYLERYESSVFKLKSVLMRRVARAKMQQIQIDGNEDALIEEVIKKMQDLGYVNDLRYAENQWRILSGSGKSVHYITQKLKQTGIDDDVIEQIISGQEQSSSEMDLSAARMLVKKRKLGKYHTNEERRLMFQRDLSILGRAGFSYEIAKQALEED